MSLLTVVAISFGLAMDAFAVSVASGVIIKDLRIHHAFRIALVFGLFQGVMPLIGWLAGMTLRSVTAGVAHWVAFGLLTFIGFRMIYEARVVERAERNVDPMSLMIMLTLAIATSMDALAVGLSFAVMDVVIITPAIIIGIVTFAMSLAGVMLGDRFGSLFEGKVEVVGGLILIGLGVKIIIEHFTG